MILVGCDDMSNIYQKDELRAYIEQSDFRVFNEQMKVRLSKELAEKYDQGCYDNYLKSIYQHFQLISTLNIRYPGNANPILYIYIVPDDNYATLLRVPAKYDKGTGCGKCRGCYDLDGFRLAYCFNQRMALDYPEEETDIAKIVNDNHEIAHVIHSNFFGGSQLLQEGFAEAIPLYALGYEEKFPVHQNMIASLQDHQILSAAEVIQQERDGSFGVESLLPIDRCSFRLSYVSSYLFVRGIMEFIRAKYQLSKAEAVQKFLEIVHQSDCSNEWRIYDIANALGIPQDELLHGKDLQRSVIRGMAKEEAKKL